MYICEITKKQSKPGQPLNKVIAIYRDKTYHKFVKNEDTRVWEKVVAGTGHEPVRELSLSAEGLAIWQSWTDIQKEEFLATLKR